MSGKRVYGMLKEVTKLKVKKNNYDKKIISIFLFIFGIFITSHAFAEFNDDDWVGLWIEEGAPFPEFTNFNKTDSYLLITNSYYVIGRTNWAGQRWGQFEGELKLTNNGNAEVIDGDCNVKLSINKTDNIYKLSVFDNNICGGMNVRFKGTYILFKAN